jgi:hypothetical protein
MKQITQKERKEFVRRKLSTSREWANAALVKIFEYQTSEEKQYESTTIENGVGFTGADAPILSSLAKQFQERNSLSPKQQDIVLRKMKKYWQQIIKVSDKKKLDAMIMRNQQKQLMLKF